MRFINIHKNCEPLDFSTPFDTKFIHDIKRYIKDPQIPDSENTIEFFYDINELKEMFPYDIAIVWFCVYIDSATPEITANVIVDEDVIDARYGIYSDNIDFEVHPNESESKDLLWFLLKHTRP